MKTLIVNALPFLLLYIVSCVGTTEEPADLWSEEDRTFLVNNLLESRQELLDEIDTLNDDEWNYVPDSSAWSIGFIVEHLGLQEDMHYRELYVLSLAPGNPAYIGKTRKNDSKVLFYEISPEKGVADWFVEPLGRWCKPGDAITQFIRSRDQMIEFVTYTNVDFRSHFTFRNIHDENDFRQVRDLHQIVLTTIAHTRRHIHQIQKIKGSENFPFGKK